jgi:hypothetical protein
MHERQITSEEHVWHGYWQREQADPDKNVPEGHWFKQLEFIDSK